MTTVLFFRPDADQAMQYASSWLGAAIDEATKRGYNVVDLVNEACTFETLKATLQSEQIALAFMGGHGNATLFTGWQQQIVLEACTNDEVMTGTISHFLSCSVGQMLLPSMISKKAVSTIGYQVDFQFMIDVTKPVESDPLAEPFKDLTVTIIKNILDGKSLKDVWQAGIDKCNEWIAKVSGRPETDWAEVISCLMHDRDGLIALGDKEAYVSPPRGVLAGLTAPQAIGLGTLFWLLMFRG
jgi:hypothetical protein